ncbi:winged helix-turn-helix transcriptional regulator [Candidatus Bathyarchaeota archaeon]|nr:winged helix-turn-helix transcriptional regulator [Candidatus Bathyarchaeota archaeon]
MSYESQSYLTVIRNVDKGLKTRTSIIKALKEGYTTIRGISEVTGIRYQTVLRHLKNMEKEGVVARKPGRPYKWSLTGKGQQNVLKFT